MLRTLYNAAVYLALFYFIVGSLVVFMLATLGVIDSTYRIYVGMRFRMIKTIVACVVAMVIWPKIVRKLFEHPRLGRRLAKNLWGRS